MLRSIFQKFKSAAWLLGLLAGWAGVFGCVRQPENYTPLTTPSPSHRSSAHVTPAAPAPTGGVAAPPASDSPSMLLREGDTVRISFPGAPSLDTTQTIRTDGKISLDMVGEMKAGGLTPKELEQKLLKAYYDQLVVKEVTVTVQSSVFVVYVTGAVLRPGKLTSDRCQTPLEAVIEAGVDPEKSNLKKVVVIREEPNGATQRFDLNLDDVLKGRPTRPFTLKSMDKIYVPEKFAWF